ncbi:hypothetical protein Tco_0015225 [Tanacetum coccineum]
MTQQIIPAAQLVPKFQGIGRCNNYAMLQSIPCSPECKIVGKILLDHPLSYALTTTANVPAITYTVDIFCDTLKLPVETLDNPFVAPVNIETIESFMQTVGYQGVVDKTKINILQLFHAVVNRTNVDYAALLWINEDYHSIKDDIPLEIRATDDYKELVLGSHKENPKYVDDDDDKQEEKVDEKEGNEMGSLEIRTEKMQTPIPITPRSSRINLSSDKNIVQELTDTVSLSTPTTSKAPHKQRHISSKYNHLPGALRRMCRLQGYMIKNMDQKCVTTDYFWKTHKKVDQVLYEIIPQIAERATDDLIENNLKPCIAEIIIKDVHPTTTTSTDTTSSADLKKQLYLKMKKILQDRANDIALWEGEKRIKRQKISKSSKSVRGSSLKRSVKDSTTYVSKQQQQQQQEWDAWVKETIINEDENFNEDARLSIQHWKDSWHKRVYKKNQRRVKDNPEDYFSNHRITEVVRITTDQPHSLDFMEQIIMMRENDKPDSYSEADFIYLNKNDIKDLYYLCRNKKIVKFCDATLEKVMKEVKLKIFQSEPWKKPPLLGELDRDLMRAFKREITKRLSHREQMRRWESFVNGKPILSTMKRL